MNRDLKTLKGNILSVFEWRGVLSENSFVSVGSQILIKEGSKGNQTLLSLID